MNRNGASRIPIEVIDPPFREIRDVVLVPRPRKRHLWPALLLFLLTVLTTLAVGSEFSVSYRKSIPPFSASDNPFAPVFQAFEHPHLLLLGIPFSFTLIAILLAHELGHYFACRYYRIDASFPYFIPGPPYFGTFGAFILIRSPFTTRRALFDIGIAGPIAGFLVAVPAMAWAVATSKVLPAAQTDASVVFGVPALMQICSTLFHPNIDPNWLLLHPVGRAAWMGLLATALNLFPAWQLDGGHIVFALSSNRHQRISIAVSLTLLAMGVYGWHVWAVWGIVLLILSLRFLHPPLLDRWEPLDASRKLLAFVALAIFLLSFTPWPATNP
jgi:membrane-associated protease RseP (regulator of RpoE activity)